ncbi:MAG: hypothetical protein IPH07_14630 [Deltaproteobacteria bacterium]|nr:hypothetical protein [Deltaproteobacteria bacterium]MBK8239012.1 hypothetical protein [Deltaproteobacteria bacterium]MBK8717527.1 hypothetical protein [Deltaproteobacteria bacterium]MBP7285867.1 hypothetical protein [Nannocystaceae bacterium]
MTAMLGLMVLLSSTPAMPVAGAATAPADAPTESATRPRWRGLGLTISGAALGTAWFGLALTAALSDADIAREQARGESPRTCIEFCMIGPAFHWAGTPLLITGAALIGGGAHLRGRWLAREGRGIGRSLHRGRVLAGTGGGLLAAGVLGLALGVSLQGHPNLGPQGGLAVREVGWWSATVFGIGGAALAGLGHGIIRGHRERASRVQLGAAPMLGGGVRGLSLSGRF